MMDTDAVNAAVLDWMHETLPELATGYDYLGERRDADLAVFGDGSFPDVIVDVATTQDGQEFSEFPYAQLQQTWVRIWRINFSIMVDNSASRAASKQLRDFSDTLRRAISTDGNLGERVQLASPIMTFDFTQPFVRYQDGTRGREVIGSMAVGELIDVNP